MKAMARAAMVGAGLVWAILWAAGDALAAPPVGYGNEIGGAAVGKVNSVLQGLATDIRDILGFTALLTLLAAALVKPLLHEPRAKERARELVVAAIVGFLIAAFAPMIVNFLESL